VSDTSKAGGTTVNSQVASKETATSVSFATWLQGLSESSWRAVDKGLVMRPPWWRIDVAGAIAVAVFVAATMMLGVVAAVVLLAAALASAAVAALRHRSNYRQDCTDALPDALSLMASALQSGHTLPQGLRAAIRAGGPLAQEFSRVQLRMRLGESLPDSLDAMAARLRSVDLAWVATVLRVNAKVGGDVAVLLETTAATLRERIVIRRTVRALSAEGRLSALVLGALPPAFAALLMVAQPSHLQPLVADARGWSMLAAACVLFALGLLWLRHAVSLRDL